MKHLESICDNERLKMRQAETDWKKSEEDLRLDLKSTVEMNCKLEEKFYAKESNLLNQIN